LSFLAKCYYLLVKKENAVPRICAWCGKEVGQEVSGEVPRADSDAPNPLQVNPQSEGTKRGEEQETTSTICPDCAEWLTSYRKPVLVVSREWARMYDQLVERLKGQPEIEVVLDRRGSESGGVGWGGPERRGPASFVLR
jgi:hypothetical protein